jgi:hypothetical protein
MITLTIMIMITAIRMIMPITTAATITGIRMLTLTITITTMATITIIHQPALTAGSISAVASPGCMCRD